MGVRDVSVGCGVSRVLTVSPDHVPEMLCVDDTVYSQNLSYPGTLGLGGARNSDLSVSQNTI